MDVVVLRPGALGDTLMLAPAAGIVSRTRGVAVAGREPGISFLKRVAARVYNMEFGGFHRLFWRAPGSGGLPVGDAALVVAFISDREGIVAENLRRCFPRADVYLFPAFPEEGRSIHAAGYIGECLEAAGLPVDADAAVSYASGDAVLSGRAPADGRKPWVVLHPGSGGRRKNHSSWMWRELAEGIRGRWPGEAPKLVWIAGPAESRELASIEYLSRATGGRTVFCPDPVRLSSLLEECSLYVGQDSGVTHLAAMSGAPTVALFRASDPARWRPLGPAVEVVTGLESREFLEDAVSSAMRIAAFDGCPDPP